MTTLSEAMDRASQAAHGVKENELARYGRANSDISSAILVYRGDDLIAIVHTGTVNRNKMIEGVQMAAFGFNADLIAVVMETYYTTLMQNPMTGQDWEPGEMTEVADHHRGREEGWVTDALTLTACNRAGDLAMRTLLYRIRKNSVQWLPEPDFHGDKENEEVTGVVPEALREAMAAPSMDHAILAAAGGMPPLPPEETVAISDIATATMLQGNPRGRGGYAVSMIAEEGSVRAKLFAEGLGEHE